MVRFNSAAGLDNPLQSIFPKPIVATRAPTTSDTNYAIGQTWVVTSANQAYTLTSVSAGSANWSLASPGSSDVDTLTGDSGGALSPTAGNINILGGDGLTVAGSGSTLTINRDAEGGYPVTPYVVGASGDAGYTTVQAAVNAANAAGSGIVVVQPGTYTEDLTLYDGIHVMGLTFADAGGGAIISGTHTPPTSGGFVFRNVRLISPTAIFSSVAAGTAHLIISDADVRVTNGFMFNLVNWTGKLEIWDVNATGGTNDGAVNNTGGSEIAVYASAIGAGTGQTMVTGGLFDCNAIEVLCPIDCQTGTTLALDNCVAFSPVTFSNDTEGSINLSSFSGGASAAITMSSSGNIAISSSVIDSSNTPAIAGAGAGTLSLQDISFLDDSTISTSLTLGGGNTKGLAFETLAADAGLTISGNDIDADGTDTNISITVSPKGTGNFIVDGGDIQATAGDIIATRSSAGADVTVESTNSDNTNAASRGGFEAAVGGTSAGDPYVNFLISGGQTFTMGIDNSSTNDDFVISDNATLGTNDRLVIDGSTGNTSITGNLLLPTAATQLQVEGGAVTDFIGTATLVAGTVTIANTNIAATDRVFIQRQDVNGSTAVGELTYSITASTSFTVTSVQPATPGSTETNDTSIIMYWIVRQL